MFSFLEFWESSANKQINHEIVNLQKLLLVENYTHLLSISLDFHNSSQIIFLHELVSFKLVDSDNTLTIS